MKHHIALLGLLLTLVGGQGIAQAGFSLAIPGDLASRQISVKVGTSLTSTRKLPRASLRSARVKMLAKQVISDEELRALAGYGDGLAALKYVRLLVARHGASPEHASDIAYYGAIAVGSGRIWPLEDMVSAMRLLDAKSEPTKRINKYYKVLNAHAWAGNTLALDALVDFNGKGRLFGALLDKTRARILKQSEANGGGRVELRLAIGLMTKSEITPEDKELARGYLVLASNARDLAIKTTAQNLLLLLEKDEN